MSVTGRCDLVFSTDRFNLSQPRDYFINDCCFGDDAASWLVDQLRARGITATDPDQEDWGWYFDAQFGGTSYFVGVGGNSNEENPTNNRGEWRLMVEKHRTLWEKITGANQLDDHDAFVTLLHEIVTHDSDLQLLAAE